jgi:hypothetical protein
VSPGSAVCTHIHRRKDGDSPDSVQRSRDPISRGPVDREGCYTVQILRAVFVNPLSLLLVSATSSAAPEAELFLTAPEDGRCQEHVRLRRLGQRYIFLEKVTACGNLEAVKVCVESSLGGSACTSVR